MVGLNSKDKWKPNGGDVGGVRQHFAERFPLREISIGFQELNDRSVLPLKNYYSNAFLSLW